MRQSGAGLIPCRQHGLENEVKKIKFAVIDSFYLKNLYLPMKKILAIIILTLACSLSPAAVTTGLRCEYLENPLGIDAPRPRFSWNMEADGRGREQKAYRIIVAASPEKLAKDQGDMWNSGKVASSASVQIEYAGKQLRSGTRYYWKVKVWDEAGKELPWSEPALWGMGLLDEKADWKAGWIGVQEENPGDYAKPRYLRTSFPADKKIERATAYVTALGLYELRINGRRVGDHLLAPEWTNYHNRVQYQTYDVTGLVGQGENAIGAMLGNGWYCGGWQFWQSSLKKIYGEEPFLLAQVEIEFSDGSRRTVITDGSWKGTCDGPLMFSGIYEGVTYDANKEMAGWDKPGFDDSRWKAVKTPGTDVRIGRLAAQRNEPVRETMQVKTVRVTEPKPGIYVFDLGQNMVGWGRLKIRGAKGDKVMMLHAEMLNPDGSAYVGNLHAGHLSPGDRQVNRYVCKGGDEEVFEPCFTYHGFRYIEVYGLTERPEPEDLTGIVFHSAFPKTGTFECSNDMVNKLVENIQWSQRGNFMSIPTDCPQRDERCGYTGDANFFMGAAVYNFDVAGFFNKWLVDLCQDSQLPSGGYADHAPDYGPGSNHNVGWSDAGIFCPYIVYRTYGDTQIIREHYESMRRCMEWQIATASSDGIRTHVGNGDWLHLGGNASNKVIATSHYIYSLKLMSEMAGAIGRTADEKRYAELARELAENFVKVLMEPDGKIKESSQTGYALAFTMDLIPDELKEKAAQRFREEIDRFDGHLATGFIGTPRLLPALHLAGADDVAYSLLLQEDFPSWLFQVRNGATSIWERWDGWRPDRGFQDSGMNSFNHYSFGAVGEYLYRMIGGISETEPGYRKIQIKPVVDPRLQWANTGYKSQYGEIATNWSLDNNTLSLGVTIPANTTATVYVPAGNAGAVLESGGPASEAKGVKFLRSENGYAVYTVGSGDYRFVSAL